MDTIVALTTGSVPAGLAVIRLSGSQALVCARKFVQFPEHPQPRRAILTTIFHPDTGAKLDQAILLYFKSPASFTGEDVIELQCHGGLKHVRNLLEAAHIAGARAAEPGEFSRRAVLNGRMSLERAEAAADLAIAETEAALAAARSQLFGALGAAIQKISSATLELRAEVEASLDFPDDAGENPPFLHERAENLASQCNSLLKTHKLGLALREGVRLVLAGAPNAGKSSIFNALVGEDRAIVDEEAGTTRDALEARIELDGIPCTLVDTAGLRDGAGRVEQRGIEKAKAEIERGGLCLWIIDPMAPVSFPEELRRCGEWLEVINKSDLGCGKLGRWPCGSIVVSAETGEGLEALRSELANRFRGNQAGIASEVLVTNRRHAELLAEAEESFQNAARNVLNAPLEIIAYDLAGANRALDKILGRCVDDSLLDEIFAKFCIGK